MPLQFKLKGIIMDTSAKTPAAAPTSNLELASMKMKGCLDFFVAAEGIDMEALVISDAFNSMNPDARRAAGLAAHNSMLKSLEMEQKNLNAALNEPMDVPTGASRG